MSATQQYHEIEQSFYANITKVLVKLSVNKSISPLKRLIFHDLNSATNVIIKDTSYMEQMSFFLLNSVKYEVSTIVKFEVYI